MLGKHFTSTQVILRILGETRFIRVKQKSIVISNLIFLRNILYIFLSYFLFVRFCLLMSSEPILIIIKTYNAMTQQYI